MNDIQKAAYLMVRESICNSVDHSPARFNAIKVVTPFLDWVGENISIYITAEGEITDGERTLNQIRAMRVYDEFKDLVKESDYFEDFNINQNGGSLDPKYLESPDDIIRYIHGIARIPMLFEVNPISDKDDRFPTLVRTTTMNILMNEYKDRSNTEDVLKWAHKISHSYLIPTKSGAKIHSDMRPVSKNKNVQIIGMAASDKSAQDAHVAAKLHNSLYLKKTNRNARTIVVVNDILKYSKNSQIVIMEEANPLIQYKEGKTAERELAAQVVEAC